MMINLGLDVTVLVLLLEIFTAGLNDNDFNTC